MENKPLRDWIRENLVYHDPSGVVICRACTTPECIRSLNTLRTHLRERHGYTGAVGVVVVNEILLSSGHAKSISPMASRTGGTFLLPPTRMPKCLDGLLLTQRQKMYWNAPDSMNEKVQSLPAIPFLPVTTGFQCPYPNCFQSYHKMDSLRTHVYKYHKTKCRITPENVKLQSLSSHENRRKYFPIHELGSHSLSRSMFSKDFDDMVEPAERDGKEQVSAPPREKGVVINIPINNEEDFPFSDERPPPQLPVRGASGGDQNEDLMGDRHLYSECEASRAIAEDETLMTCDSAGYDQKESRTGAGICRAAASTALPKESLLSSQKVTTLKQVSFRCSPNSADTRNNNRNNNDNDDNDDNVNEYNNDKDNDNDNDNDDNNKNNVEVDGNFKEWESTSTRKRSERSERVKNVGSQVWDMVKNLNPAFRGHCPRQLSTKRNNMDVLCTLETNGDDQLLETKGDCDKQGQDLFEVLCFREVLSFLGYESLRDVPVELVRPARFEALRPSLVEMIGKSIPGVGVQRTGKKRRGMFDGSTFNADADADDSTDEDADDRDDVFVVDKNNEDEDDLNTDGEHDVFESESHKEPRQTGRISSRSSGRREGQGPKEDIQVGSMLLSELGFSESILNAQCFMYLKTCRSLTYQCSESARRLVHTRERSITGGEKRSSHDPRDRFKPVTRDGTLRDYAKEVSSLVLFCLRLSVIKLTYYNVAFPKVTRETQEQYGFNEQSFDMLESLRQKHKPSLLSRSKIESKYGKLISLIPDKVVWSAWSYIERGASFKRLHDDEDMDDAKVCGAFWESLKSLHSIFCSVLLQTVQDPASTNRVWSRHFAAISSVSHCAFSFFAHAKQSSPGGIDARSGGDDAEQKQLLLLKHQQKKKNNKKNNENNNHKDQRDKRNEGDGAKTSPEKEIASSDCHGSSHVRMPSSIDADVGGAGSSKIDKGINRYLESFQLKRAWQMSTLFSALLYMSSCCGLWELYHNGNENLTSGMHLELVRDGFCFDKNNSVSLLREFISEAMHVLKNSDGGLNFLSCSRPGPEHAMCAWVDTVECSIPRLRDAVMSWQQKLRDVIEQKLFLGMKLPAGFWEDVAGSQDHFRMVNRGFNVFSRAAHERFATRCGHLIAEHIASDTELFYRVFRAKNQNSSSGNNYPTARGENNKSNDACGAAVQFEIRHDSGAVAEYHDHCRKALDLALVLTHVVGGAPARGTELETYLLENTADSMRSFFVFHGQVILRPSHNKTRSMSATNREIARFLDVETSRLWVLLLAIVPAV